MSDIEKSLTAISDFPDFREIHLPDVPIPMVQIVDLEKRIPDVEFISTERSFPAAFETIKNAIIAEKVASGQKVNDGSILSLVKIEADAINTKFTYQPARYFHSIATTYPAIDREIESGITARQKFGDLDQMIIREGYNNSPYSKQIGVSSIVITKDGYAILQKRSGQVGIAAGNWHVSLAEGMQSTDIDQNGKISPIASIRRGLRQELGFYSTELVQSISVLGLGISKQYLQPDFAALVKLNCDADELFDVQQKYRKTEDAKGRWETERLTPEIFSPENITNLLKDKDRVWSPHASFTLALSIHNQFHNR